MGDRGMRFDKIKKSTSRRHISRGQYVEVSKGSHEHEWRALMNIADVFSHIKFIYSGRNVPYILIVSIVEPLL